MALALPIELGVWIAASALFMDTWLRDGRKTERKMRFRYNLREEVSLSD